MAETMNMVERVARAMALANWPDDSRWKNYEKSARAAIEAMREPTEAMVDAAYANMDKNRYEQGNPASDYAAMIDAALTHEGSREQELPADWFTPEHAARNISQIRADHRALSEGGE